MRLSLFVFFYFSLLLCGTSKVLCKGDDLLQENTDYLKAKACLTAADYPCAQTIFNKLLMEAKLADNSLSTAGIYLALGEMMYQKGTFGVAKLFFDSALVLANKHGYRHVIADVKQNLAHINWRYGDNYSALDNISHSISIYEKVGDTSAYLNASTILAGIYISLQKYDESEKIYDRLLKTAYLTNDSAAITTCYQHLGVIAYYQEDYARAVTFYKSAISWSHLLNDNLLVALNQGNLGEALLAQGNFLEANDYLQKSLKSLKGLNFNSGIIFVLHTLGRVHHELENYDNAQQYYLASLNLMIDTGEIRERNYVYQLISDNLESKGNYKEALSYYKKYSAEKDSLFGLEKTKQLEELRAQYQLVESDSLNRKLSLENEQAMQEINTKQKLINYQYIITSLVLISMMIIIGQFFILRNRKKKLEISNDTKNRLFNIIAHDIKNPINNISSLLEIWEQSTSEQEKNRILNMLQQASKSASVLVNSILSWSISNKEGFQFKFKEIRLFEITKKAVDLFIYQLESKSLVFNNEIPPDYTLYTDADAIATIIRNLLSNAIKFTPAQGSITIWISESQYYNQIHVKDSGLGMDQKTINSLIKGDKVRSELGTEKESGTGVGYTLINEFVEKLKGKIEIVSTPNNGTEVIIFIPKA